MPQSRPFASGVLDLVEAGERGSKVLSRAGPGNGARVTLQPVLWSIIGTIITVDLVWGAAAGLSIEGWWRPLFAAGFLLSIAWLYARRSRILADTAHMASLWICFTAAGCVLTYLAATCAQPLQDGMLARMDQALGFDWLAWRDAVAAHRVLYAGLFLAYASLMTQILASVIVLPALGMTGRCAELILLAAVTLAPTTLIAAAYPVLGPFAVFSVGDLEYLPHVLALRAPGPWHFDIAEMLGIVTMPSYHTVLAVLFTYAYRNTGLIGWAVAGVNGAMLLSIPPVGGHYLVDVLVGGMIAVLCIMASRNVTNIRQPGTPFQPA